MKRFLAKKLFPRVPPDVQRRKLNIVLAVLTISILLAAVIGLIMFNSSKVGVR